MWSVIPLLIVSVVVPSTAVLTVTTQSPSSATMINTTHADNLVNSDLIKNNANSITTMSTTHCPRREHLSNSWAGLTIERRVKMSPLVFHGLAVETYPPVSSQQAPPKGFYYTAQFWLISVYKGAQPLAKYFDYGPPVNGVYDIRDR